jgi:GT2 family glycosyltransferase
MEIDIIILFYNKVEQTISCVNSFLLSGQYIYVLNNGSDATQLKKLKKTFEGNLKVVILDPGKNLGVACGRNYLLKHTKSPWIFSVDNDIFIENHTDWVRNLEEFCKLNHHVEIIAPRLYNVHESDYSLQINVQVENNKVQLITGILPVCNCFPGGAVIIHRNVFEKHGFFDECMFVGFEDYEFALRALLSNNGPLEVHSIETIKLIHDHQFQKKKRDRKAVKERYNEDKIKASHNRLMSKYNIVFEHDWLHWTKNQVEVMTKPRLLTKFKHKVWKVIFR